MAATDFSALTNLQRKIWSARVWMAGRDSSLFLGTPGFMSRGVADSTRPIHLVDELRRDERGDKCVLPIVLDLQGDGVVGTNEQEGYEESLVADEIEIQIDKLRNGIKSKGEMAEQKTVIVFRTQARDKLGYWLGSRVDEILFLVGSGVAFTKKLDQSTRPANSQLPSLAFAAGVTAPSSKRQKFGGTATSTANIAAGDKMTWNLLITAKSFAIRKRIKPVRVNGRDTYIVVMSPEAARDLKTDSDYKTIIQNAGARGASNELFTGAFANVDGLILYEHAKAVTTFGLVSGSTKWGAGSDVDGTICLLMGAQALGFARIGEPKWQEQEHDYKDKPGMSYGQIIGAKKPVFQSIYDDNTEEDFSMIAVHVASKP